MRTRRLFLAACLCTAVFTACSTEEGNTPDPGTNPKEEFSLIAPDGKFYAEGQTVAVSLPDESGVMRLNFDVKNNTEKVLMLSMGQKILSSNYNKIAQHATFCWDACYSNLPLPEGFTATQTVIAGGNPLGKPSGDIMNIDTTTPSFEATVEYTITNKANGEKRTLVGHYKYTQK